MNKLTIIWAAFVIALSQSIFSPHVVNAYSVPTFPSCPNPGGNQISSYSSGVHGIPGDSTTYSGSDAVYQINSSQTVQCFCPSTGSGIQTNWLKTANLSDSEITSYKNSGWIFIPDGSLWGLDASTYMAQNITFNCVGGGSDQGSSTTPAGGTGSAPVCESAKPNAPVLLSVKRNGTTATLTWSAVQFATHYTISYGIEPGKFIYGVPNTGNVTQFTVASLDQSKTYYWEVRAVNNCAPSDSSSALPIGGGEVLGESTFAPTGQVGTVILFAGVGMILLGLSLILSNRREAQK